MEPLSQAIARNGKHECDMNADVSGGYYPDGPFIGHARGDDAFERAREDFLLDFLEPTARAYYADLEDFREWCAALSIDPLDVTESRLPEFRKDLVRRSYCQATVGRRVSTVRRFIGRTPLPRG